MFIGPEFILQDHSSYERVLTWVLFFFKFKQAQREDYLDCVMLCGMGYLSFILYGIVLPDSKSKFKQCFFLKKILNSDVLIFN